MLKMLTILAGAAALAGCGDRAVAQKDSPPPCLEELPATGPQTPAVAILVQKGAMDRPRQEAVTRVVAGAEEMQAHVLVSGIGAEVPDTELLVSAMMVPEGANDLMREADLRCKKEAVDAEIATLAGDEVDGKLDVFSSLRAVKASVEETPHGPVHVVVIGSLVSRAPIDLSDRRLLANPAVGINALADMQLNFRCAGWRVYAVNPSRGTSAAVDPVLKRWWQAYFRRCGGDVVAWNVSLSQFPIDRPVAGADAGKLPVKVERRAQRVVATLRDEVLFATGSHTLRAGAGAALAQLIPHVAKARGAITVTGHTDDTGTDAVNRPLSLARARTVAAWLRRHGDLPRGRVRTVGMGSAQPVASNESAAGRARNRRVVVEMRTS